MFSKIQQSTLFFVLYSLLQVRKFDAVSLYYTTHRQFIHWQIFMLVFVWCQPRTCFPVFPEIFCFPRLQGSFDSILPSKLCMHQSYLVTTNKKKVSDICIEYLICS